MSRNVDAAAITRALQQEYDEAGALLSAQPTLTQRFIEAQARTLADALVQHLGQVRFTLPDRVAEATGARRWRCPPISASRSWAAPGCSIGSLAPPICGNC